MWLMSWSKFANDLQFKCLEWSEIISKKSRCDSLLFQYLFGLVISKFPNVMHLSSLQLLCFFFIVVVINSINSSFFTLSEARVVFWSPCNRSTTARNRYSFRSVLKQEMQLSTRFPLPYTVCLLWQLRHLSACCHLAASRHPWSAIAQTQS